MYIGFYFSTHYKGRTIGDKLKKIFIVKFNLTWETQKLWPLSYVFSFVCFIQYKILNRKHSKKAKIRNVVFSFCEKEIEKKIVTLLHQRFTYSLERQIRKSFLKILLI